MARKFSFDIIQLTFDGTTVGNVFGYLLVGHIQVNLLRHIFSHLTDLECM